MNTINPLPFILAVIFALIAYLCGGVQVAIITTIVWLSIVVVVTILTR